MLVENLYIMFSVSCQMFRLPIMPCPVDMDADLYNFQTEFQTLTRQTTGRFSTLSQSILTECSSAHPVMSMKKSCLFLMRA